MAFYDGLTNVLNSLVNRRSAVESNVFTARRLNETTLRNLYRSGLGSKIVRLKSTYALNDTIKFDTDSQEDIYKAKFAKKVRLAARYMLSFGRGVIVVHHPGDNLSDPLTSKLDITRARISVFSGDMVSPSGVILDLDNPRYYKPESYNVRGQNIHHSRVIDFTYVEPSEFEAQQYRYGGISEFELIYDQLVADGTIERASATIVEKNSTIFYKVAGFKEALRSKNDSAILEYFGKLEEHRSIYGAGILDAEDAVESVTQALTNLSDVSDTSLRRIAMVTGIPVSVLVGESVRGLNASGENELTVFQHTIGSLQDDFLTDPINALMFKFGLDNIEFKDNQAETPEKRIEYESKAIDNALKLWQMGEDHEKYLSDKEIIKDVEAGELFWQVEEEAELPSPEETLQSLGVAE